VVDFCGRRQEDLEDTSDMVAYKLALPDYMRMHDVSMSHYLSHTTGIVGCSRLRYL